MEYNTQRLSFGYATMVGDRDWRNDEGGTLVFNPRFWRLPQPKDASVPENLL